MNAFQAQKYRHLADDKKKRDIYAAVHDWASGNPYTLEQALNRYGWTSDDMTEDDEDYIAELTERIRRRGY